MAHVSWPFLYAGGKLDLYPNIRTELCLSLSLSLPLFSEYSCCDYSVLTFLIYSLSTSLSPSVVYYL